MKSKKKLEYSKEYIEQVRLLEGADVWHTHPIDYLPPIMMADGPHGLRKQRENKDNIALHGSIPATAFPTASLVACSFDRGLIVEMAQRIALEAQANQVHVVLGPGMNLKRSPLCGRNFEYFSEDPLLSGELASSYVRAMEDAGTGSCIKHFVCNNQEKHRFYVDSIVDERALHELYLRGFKRALRENPAMMMVSYNKINGFYGTENPLLKEFVRKEWKYDGVVVSDWGAIQDRIQSLKATCDLEMPSTYGYSTNKLLEASKEEEVVQAVKDSSNRIERLMKRFHTTPKQMFDEEKHHQEAKRIAIESMVLLKNEQALPFKKQEKVVLISGFIHQIRYQGGGSSHINPTKLDQFVDIASNYSKQLTLMEGFTLKGDGFDLDLIDEAKRAVVNADKVIIVAGLPEAYETEGFDRRDLDLPKGQYELIERIAEAHSNVTVIVLGGSVVNLSFADKVQGLMMAYLGGQATASAILDLVYGEANPSGRLAETFIDSIEQCNVQLTEDNQSVYYDESIYVGYRYYETYKKPVRYPFGYGLSYTTFHYSNYTVEDGLDRLKLKLLIENTGTMDGKEVIQLYVEGPKSSVHKPIRELKQFDKVFIKAGETKEVTLFLDKKELEYYDLFEKKFVLESGIYHIQVGRNVSDIIVSIPISLKGEEVIHPALSYGSSMYDTSDFQELFSDVLPEKQKTPKRPFAFSSTLTDVEHTVVGKIIRNRVLKEAEKTMQGMEETWMREVMKQTIMETPIRTLALFSGGKITLEFAEGMIDILNFNMLKGIKKMTTKPKEKKDDESTSR